MSAYNRRRAAWIAAFALLFLVPLFFDLTYWWE